MDDIAASDPGEFDDEDRWPNSEHVYPHEGTLCDWPQCPGWLGRYVQDEENDYYHPHED